MSADYDRLKEYLSETKTASTNSKFPSANVSINGFMNFFKKPSVQVNSNGASGTGDQAETDSWFREAELDPYCPKLSKKQRIIGFMLFIFLGVFFMATASLFIPVLLLKSRKFVLLFSLGSLFFISSFSLLWGVKSHLKHLFNTSRLPFTMAYFGTLLATIYYAMWIQSVTLTIIFAILQVGSLIWYLMSYLPGGQSAFKLFAKLFYAFASKTAQTVLPM